VIRIEDCEKAIPEIFKNVYDIIQPALVKCGQIKDGINDKFMVAMFKNILNLQ
jgi:hypothetical protein